MDSDFPKTKTVCMHLLHSVHAEPELTLDGDTINVFEETTFLGLIFDTKLSFMPHIKYLKTRCLKVVDIIRVLSSSEWDRCSALRVLNLGLVTIGLLQHNIQFRKEFVYWAAEHHAG